jgi:hypothetical protein
MRVPLDGMPEALLTNSSPKVDGCYYHQHMRKQLIILGVTAALLSTCASKGSTGPPSEGWPTQSGAHPSH